MGSTHGRRDYLQCLGSRQRGENTFFNFFSFSLSFSLSTLSLEDDKLELRLLRHRRRVAARTVTGGPLRLVSFSRFAVIPSVSLPSICALFWARAWLRKLLRCRGVLIRWSLSFLWNNGEKVERWVEIAVGFLGYGWRSIFSFRSRPAFSVREEERRGVLSWVSTVRCSSPGGSRLRRVSLVGF